MTDTDAYREAFGPGLLGKHAHHSDIAFEKSDGAIRPVFFCDPVYPADESPELQVTPTDVRAIKAAEARGAMNALGWVRTWLGAAGFGGLKGQAVALADALRAIPDATFAELCERSGVLKQTGHLARERLHAVLPMLAAAGLHSDQTIQKQQQSMRESWRKRKEKAGSPQPGSNEVSTNENHGGLST
jgi:hypothetical protein